MGISLTALDKVAEQQPVLFGRYRCVQLLGKGASGAILRALDLHKGNAVVALKLLLNRDAFDESTVQRFAREWEICRSINHPNIVRAYDFIQTPEGMGYTMEYVPGHDLAWHIQRGPLPSEEIVRIAKGALDGLTALHALGIVHRDMKLENIMVADDRSIKLLDLGLMREVRTVQDLTRTGILLGTAQYMPPEYVRNATYDERSDLYALGFVLYELLSNIRWLQGKGGAEAIDFLCRTDFKIPFPEVPSGPSAALWLTTRQALDPRPRRRFRSAAEMRAALDAAPHTFKTPHTNGDSFLRATEPRLVAAFLRHRPALIGLVAVALIAVVAIGLPLANFGEDDQIIPGYYRGETSDADGNHRSLELSISASGLFVVWNSEECSSGFVNALTGEISCSQKGVVFHLEKARSETLTGSILTPDGSRLAWQVKRVS
jgi:serine/threonine protein kinase